jgi:hypothetical protein
MKKLLTLSLCFMQLTHVLGALQQEQRTEPVNRFHRELADKIQATLTEHPETLDLCLERLRYLVLSDRVGFYLNISAEWEDNRIVLHGDTERREFKDIARGVFGQLGFTSVVDRVEIVPNLDSHPEPYGITVAPHVLTWSEPNLQGQPMDEALYSEPVYLLKELPNAFLIKTLTGYWGYARKDGFQRLTKPRFIRQLNKPKAILLQDVTHNGRIMPSGCRLLIETWGEGEDCVLSTPDDGSVTLPKSQCHRPDERRDNIEKLLQFARTFHASPYNLGGKNQSTGIDCSGLVQLCYRLLGVNLPRDARQQYLGGHLILPCVQEALLPGDALFFMNEAGQVDHVALYLGNDDILHASGNRVRLDSLDPTAPNYLQRLDQDFIGAKRFWW